MLRTNESLELELEPLADALLSFAFSHTYSNNKCLQNQVLAIG